MGQGSRTAAAACLPQEHGRGKKAQLLPTGIIGPLGSPATAVALQADPDPPLLRVTQQRVEFAIEPLHLMRVRGDPDAGVDDLDAQVAGQVDPAAQAQKAADYILDHANEEEAGEETQPEAAATVEAVALAA